MDKTPKTPDSNDKAAPTAELEEAKKIAADKYVSNHKDAEVRRMYGHHYRSFLAGWETCESITRAVASPVVPSTEAGQTATHYDSLHEAYTDLEKCKGLYTELQTLSKNKIESLSKELQEARAEIEQLKAEKLGDDLAIATMRAILEKAEGEREETRAALDSLREAAKRLTNYYNEFDTIDARDIEALDAALASSTSKEVEP